MPRPEIQAGHLTVRRDLGLRPKAVLYYNGEKQKAGESLAVKTTQRGWFSGNTLKLIAAVSMLIDHVGVVFFPRAALPRIIGRLAFPMFAFMIAEGCKYTRSRPRYFLTVFALAVLCQTVYFFFDGSTYLSVLVTFSLSILTIYALQFFRGSWTAGIWELRAASGLILCAMVALVWRLNRVLTIDYGFWGCMLPVFAALFQQRRDSAPDALTPLDKNWLHVTMLGVGALLLALDKGGVQIYSLLSLPLLLCYCGRRGKWNLKYFFYLFYPLHLALLEGLWLLLQYFRHQ